MLLYITAEDVFGSDTPRRRGPRPLHTIPSTVAALFDLGLRHHVRRGVLGGWSGETLEWTPDWRLDRLAIRFALFGRERLGLEPGERALVLGRLSWLWPAVDFASMGFGVVPVGLEHDAGDDAVAAIAAEAAPRAAFATDPESAQRLLRLLRSGRLGGATVVADGLAEEKGVVPLSRVLELAAVLDTPERAQSFRAFSRRVAPDGPALWHARAWGLTRLSHEAAMARVVPLLRSHPASEGDVAYVDAPRATLQKRLAMAAFVGDGLTSTVLGREERAAEDVVQVRPSKVLTSEPWLSAALDGRGSGWPRGLVPGRGRRRVREVLGDRLRWVETGAPVLEATARALAMAGIAVEVRGEEGQEDRNPMGAT